MVRSSSKRAANKPARTGPGDDAAVPDGDSGEAGPVESAGNANLGSLQPVSRGGAGKRARPAQPRLRPLLDALFRDTAAAAEAARRWSDGPGRLWREGLGPEDGAAAALEHLNIHTRLMQVMNWLLDPAHDGRLKGVKPFDHAACPPLADAHPIRAVEGVKLAEASRALHARAAALAAAHPLPDENEEAQG
jgi:hypothetical protein